MRKYLLPILLIGFWGCEDSEPEETLPNPVTLRDIIIDDSTFTISWSMNSDVDFFKYILFQGSDVNQQSNVLGDFTNRLDTTFTMTSTWDVKYFKVDVMNLDGKTSSSNIMPVNDLIDFTSINGLWKADSVYMDTLGLQPIWNDYHYWVHFSEQTFTDYWWYTSDSCFVVNSPNSLISEISENLFSVTLNPDDSSSWTGQFQINNNFNMYVSYQEDNYSFPRWNFVRQYHRDFEPECEE